MAGLVDEGGVGRRPGHVVERRRAGPPQQGQLLVRQDAPARRRDQRRGAVEVVEQLVGRQSGPHPVERRGELGHAAHLAREVLEVELVVVELRRVLVAREGRHRRGADPQALLRLAGPVGQDLGHGLLDQSAPGVVGAGPAAGALDDGAGVGGGQAEHQGAVGHQDVLGQWPLAGADGTGHELCHAHVTLQTRDVSRIVLLDPDLGHEPGDGRQGHAGLPQ